MLHFGNKTARHSRARQIVDIASSALIAWTRSPSAAHSFTRYWLYFSKPDFIIRLEKSILRSRTARITWVFIMGFEGEKLTE